MITDILSLRHRVVFMYGKESGLQRGTVELSGAHIQANQVKVDHHGFEFCLSNQIKIFPLISENDSEDDVHQHPFAKRGDSGATIFLDHENNNLAAVGILAVGTKRGVAYFTPITAFMHAFELETLSELCDQKVMSKIANQKELHVTTDRQTNGQENKQANHQTGLGEKQCASDHSIQGHKNGPRSVLNSVCALNTNSSAMEVDSD